MAVWHACADYSAGALWLRRGTAWHCYCLVRSGGGATPLTWDCPGGSRLPQLQPLHDDGGGSWAYQSPIHCQLRWLLSPVSWWTGDNNCLLHCSRSSTDHCSSCSRELWSRMSCCPQSYCTPGSCHRASTLVQMLARSHCHVHYWCPDEILPQSSIHGGHYCMQHLVL